MYIYIYIYIYICKTIMVQSTSFSLEKTRVTPKYRL